MKTVKPTSLRWSVALAVPLLALAAAVLNANPAHAQALSNEAIEPVDRVAAVVNNGVITQRELDDRTGLILNRLSKQNSAVPPEAELKRQVLDQMVLERIQLEKADDDGIVVDEAMVQRTLQRLAAQNQLSLDQYRARLTSEGVPWSTFERDAKNELILARLREREVDSKVLVSDTEVAAYLASQRGPGAPQNDLHVQVIEFNAPQTLPATELDAVQAKAQIVLKQATDPKADFGKLAAQYSQAPDAAKTSGDLGFKSPAVLPPAVVSATSQLRPGQVDESVVKGDDKLYIVKLVDRRPAQSAGADAPKMQQTHVEHILIRVGGSTSEPAARQQLVDIKTKLAAGNGDFATYARTYSQDGSAQQGGDLGWISPGETVPDFERAMNNLKVGEISDPVRTEYGYHLIQVLGRRDADVSVQQQQDLARQALGQRKAEQAYSDWLRELRDSSYVRYETDPLQASK
ncbi:MAG TPA: peptidylprolyl isomerase [Pararobbsia sp.]|nr:peptidylprolyl isomerase [Pararobbsia sp.]